MSEYYTASGWPATRAALASAPGRSELNLVSAGFDKLPTLSGNANKVVFVNGAGTGLTSVTEATAKTLLNLESGVDVLAYSAIVQDLADNLTATTTELNYVDGVTSAIQTQINSRQPLDAGLTSISGLTTAADRMIYTTASDTYAVATITSAGRAILDDADATAQRATLGLVLQSSSIDTLGEGDLYTVFNSTNTAFGFESLYSIAGGVRNTSVGKNAGGAITTGNNNVSIGMNCLSSITDTDDNIAIGQFCAYASTGISQSVIIGSSADIPNSTTNSIVIGYDAQSAGSNSVSIGNSSITSTRLRGNILIGGSSVPSGSPTNTVSIYSGTAPTGVANDSIALYSSDLSAGNTMLSLWTEGTPVASVSATSPNRTIAIRVNGTVYYLHAKTTND